MTVAIVGALSTWTMPSLRSASTSLGNSVSGGTVPGTGKPWEEAAGCGTCPSATICEMSNPSLRIFSSSNCKSLIVNTTCWASSCRGRGGSGS